MRCWQYIPTRASCRHRDPLKAVASLANLVALLRGMSSDHIDRAASAPVDGRLADVQRAMDARGNLPPDTARLRLAVRRFHPRRDRHGAAHLRALRARAQPRAEERIRAFHGIIRATSTGRTATPEDAGLDAATERERYRAYQDRFAIESE
jgi:hypothetical protein